MFHSVPGVPCVKMERFSSSALAAVSEIGKHYHEKTTTKHLQKRAYG